MPHTQAPEAPARDILWLGAHKTGTTSLQHQLSRVRAQLAAAGLFYIDTQALRARYTRPVLDLHQGDLPPPLPAGGAGYLVFDENIPGLVQDAVQPRGLYPDGEERALRLARVMGLEAPELVFGIRNFADYLPSLYCETLKALPFRSFDRFWSGQRMALSWCDLVERLLAAFPRSRLRLYRAGDLRGRENALLSWVTGLAERELPTPESALREGFSAAAIQALEMLSKRRDTGPLDLQQLLQRYPRRSAKEAFSPWSEPQRAELELLFRTDMQNLRALARQQPRLEIWQPDRAP